MKIEKEHGITMVSLIITIIILIIISGISVTVGIGSIQKARDNKLVAELTMVQHAILEQYTKYRLTKDTTYLIGNKMTKEEVQQIIEPLGVTLVTIPTTYSNKDYYKLDKAALLEIGVKEAEDEYIVNYISGEVINITQQTTKNEALYIKANSFYKETTSGGEIEEGEAEEGEIEEL